MYRPSSYVNDNQDRLVVEGRALLTAVVIDSTDATGKITLYDGLNATSGRKVMDVASPTTAAFVHQFNSPILFQNGIYVDVTDTIHDFTLLFIPIGNDPMTEEDQRKMMDY